MSPSYGNDNLKTLLDLLNKPTGAVIFPTQGIGKSMIAEAIGKYMKEGWGAITSEQKKIVREAIRNNPRFLFGKDVPQKE